MEELEEKPIRVEFNLDEENERRGLYCKQCLLIEKWTDTPHAKCELHSRPRRAKLNFDKIITNVKKGIKQWEKERPPSE